MLLPHVIKIKVFSFLYQDTNMRRSNFVEKGCNSSKKQIISNSELKFKLVDHTFLLFCLELPVEWEISSTIELTNCVAHVLSGFSIQCLKTSSDFLKTLWKCLAALLYHLEDRLPSMFPLYLSVHISYYVRPKLVARPEKLIISSARYISVAIFYLLWALGRIWNFFNKLSSQF